VLLGCYHLCIHLLLLHLLLIVQLLLECMLMLHVLHRGHVLRRVPAVAAPRSMMLQVSILVVASVLPPMVVPRVHVQVIRLVHVDWMCGPCVPSMCMRIHHV
jgi:hypothetical protein